ncbi:Fic family protein [Baekduia sp.]|uniref:Fic family protein n=1 Tax=Baekduia sp. TaxID=2600305 RepID=UPI002E06C32B|nr:Fic family protein [Baekduia sp.]
MESADFPCTTFGEARQTIGPHAYIAYFPAPLPRSFELPARLVPLLADAEAALGRLAGVGQVLPNPHLLIRPYLLREAVASTMIEGTQASLAEIFELGAAGEQPNADVEEVLAYVDAMEWAVTEAPRLPLSNRMLLETHRRLLSGVRGAERRPGEFRTTQNWIGPPGSTLQNASFVPPPPDALAEALADWERFANEEPDMPLLVQDALLHVQFETIHPFLDGNGRLGRLMLVLFLIVRGRLTAPLLYLSAGIEHQRERYYAALRATRTEGDALPWIELFLEAVRSQSIDAVRRAEKIVELRERYRRQATELGSVNALQLVDLMCENPIVTTRLVEARLGVARPTALRLLRQLADAGLLEEAAQGARGQRRYVARELMDVVTADNLGGDDR